MSAQNTSLCSIICSFCSQLLKAPSDLLGKRIKCPKCSNLLWLSPAKDNELCSELLTSWYYTTPKLLLGSDKYGPIKDDQFLELIRSQVITHRSDVRSPEWTSDEWFSLEEIDLKLVEARVAQRKAEERRLKEFEKRRQAIANDNKLKLKRLVREAITDGVLDADESESISRFASELKVATEDLIRIIQTESSGLLTQALEEALEDGVLEPAEEHRIMKASKSLKCPLNLTEKQKQEISLCRLAYRINTNDLQEISSPSEKLSLLANEVCYCESECEWAEVVESKRPIGKLIEGNKYLKPIAAGKCFITNKHATLLNSLESKKAKLASVQRVQLYTDGVFLNRSTGKSIFLKFLDENARRWEFALVIQKLVSNEPIQWLPPTQPFPVIDNPELSMTLSSVSNSHLDEPRFTFRVVGDHIGNRSHWISCLSIGERINLVREPDNPYDPNAVLVKNVNHQELGYLKREVAEWFAPLLDSSRRYYSQVFRLHDDGRLIVGVYE